MVEEWYLFIGQREREPDSTSYKRYSGIDVVFDGTVGCGYGGADRATIAWLWVPYAEDPLTDPSSLRPETDKVVTFLNDRPKKSDDVVGMRSFDDDIGVFHMFAWLLDRIEREQP